MQLRGKLDFSYAYGGVLPFFPMFKMNWLEGHWGKGYILGKTDLLRQAISESIGRIPTPFRRVMTEAQVRAACAVLDKNNKNSKGQFLGVYDQIQESGKGTNPDPFSLAHAPEN